MMFITYLALSAVFCTVILSTQIYSTWLDSTWFDWHKHNITEKDLKSLYILPDYIFMRAVMSWPLIIFLNQIWVIIMYGIDFVRLDYRISKWNNFMIHVGSGLLKLGFIASIIFWENVLVHKYFFFTNKGK